MLIDVEEKRYDERNKQYNIDTETEEETRVKRMKNTNIWSFRQDLLRDLMEIVRVSLERKCF